MVPKVSEKNEVPKIPTFRRPAWYKADYEEKTAYGSQLNKKLMDIQLPKIINCWDTKWKNPTHVKERDSLLLDTISCAIETSYENIPLQAHKRYVNPANSANQPLPGWNESIAPLKSDSIFWHSVWKSAGRPLQEHWKSVREALKENWRSVENAVGRLLKEC